MTKTLSEITHTTDVGIHENRTYKDSLFRKIFGSKCNKKNIYRKALVKLPTPFYVVFYSGTEPMEDKVFLNLSDAFMHPPREGSYEWTAIRKAMNTAITKNYLDGFFQKEKDAMKDATKSSFSSSHPLPRNRSAR